VGFGFWVGDAGLEEALVRVSVDGEVCVFESRAVFIPKYLEIEGCTSLLNSGAGICGTPRAVGKEAVFGVPVVGVVSNNMVGITFKELAC
jgi:hypothetical protein